MGGGGGGYLAVLQLPQGKAPVLRLNARGRVHLVEGVGGRRRDGAAALERELAVAGLHQKRRADDEGAAPSKSRHNPSPDPGPRAPSPAARHTCRCRTAKPRYCD